MINNPKQSYEEGKKLERGRDLTMEAKMMPLLVYHGRVWLNRLNQTTNKPSIILWKVIYKELKIDTFS